MLILQMNELPLKSKASWTKLPDLRLTLIHYLLQQNQFGTGEDRTWTGAESIGASRMRYVRR